MVDKLIYIEWEDACSNDTWMDEHSAIEWSNAGRYVVKQTGFVFKENKQHLILYGGFHEHDGYQSQYHQMIKIPKGWIRRRVNLTKYIK